MPRRYANHYERITRNVYENQHGCWIWQGTILANGYGQLGFRIDGVRQQHLAHRFSYTIFRGPIPDGLTIDHLCDRRDCVNADHLEPVTIQENIRRAVERRAARKAVSA